jgi:Cu-Zn family superoxide dismutase
MRRRARRMVAARITGGPLAPDIRGWVYFTPASGGSWVTVNVRGLPQYRPAMGDQPPVGPHEFHIHENGTCEVGDPENPYLAAGEHWNPTGQPHGNHAGDLPVLFSNNGVARMRVFTSRFRPQDVIGRSVLIHMNPDDYRTQPAGNSGRRLACGRITTWRR